MNDAIRYLFLGHLSLVGSTTFGAAESLCKMPRPGLTETLTKMCVLEASRTGAVSESMRGGFGEKG